MQPMRVHTFNGTTSKTLENDTKSTRTYLSVPRILSSKTVTQTIPMVFNTEKRAKERQISAQQHQNLQTRAGEMTNKENRVPANQNVAHRDANKHLIGVAPKLRTQERSNQRKELMQFP